MVDDLIARRGLDAPPAEPDHTDEPVDLDPPTTLDLRAHEIASVVWCTGFGGDFSWLDPALLDGDRKPRRQDAAAALPGVFYLGLQWLTRRASGILPGFSTDSATVADAIKSSLPRTGRNHHHERTATMTQAADQKTLESLEVFVGEWSMVASFTPNPADAPRARTTFEWLPGRRFLIQRWEVEHPDAPDGIAIIGFDADRATLLQHYFDSRGVARVYQMTFADKVWRLQRLAAAPDFSQRFTGTFVDEGNTIVGRWEISNDGSTWDHDFDLTYTRLR